MARLDAKTKEGFAAKALVMKALAHPTRLFIVDELSRGERCVRELRDMIGVDISTVSKHLALLRGSGLVVDQRRGQQVFYRLRTPCVLEFFDCVQKCQGFGEDGRRRQPARRAERITPLDRDGGQIRRT